MRLSFQLSHALLHNASKGGLVSHPLHFGVLCVRQGSTQILVQWVFYNAPLSCSGRLFRVKWFDLSFGIRISWIYIVVIRRATCYRFWVLRRNPIKRTIRLDSLALSTVGRIHLYIQRVTLTAVSLEVPNFFLRSVLRIRDFLRLWCRHLLIVRHSWVQNSCVIVLLNSWYGY